MCITKLSAFKITQTVECTGRWVQTATVYSVNYEEILMIQRCKNGDELTVETCTVRHNIE